MRVGCVRDGAAGDWTIEPSAGNGADYIQREKMSEENTAIIESPGEAEEMIRPLAGVLSCRVVTDAAGLVLEIHVVASRERHPKQIIRDIETVLFTSMGVRVDHKKISVAVLDNQTREKKEEVPVVKRPVVERLKFIDMSMKWTPDGGAVEVILSRGAFRGIGETSFSVSPGPLRAAVEATLKAVGMFVAEGAFQLGSVEKKNLGNHEAVFVQIQYVSSNRSMPLVGSALVVRDGNLSALFATLDAVNRYLGRLESAEGIEWIAGAEPAAG